MVHSTQRTNWQVSHYTETRLNGRFPTFPSIEEGGSAALKDWKPEDSAVEETPSARSGQNSRKGVKTPAKPSATAIPPSRRGNKKEEEKLPPIELPKSKFFPTLSSKYLYLLFCINAFSLTNYNTTWKDRNETNNFAQKHDPELIKQALRPDVEKEVQIFEG